MPAQQITLKTSSISIDAAAADQLLTLGSGDAALLFLYLLRSGGVYEPNAAGRLLRRSRGQLDTAMAQLQEVGLAAGALLPVTEPPAPQPDQAPEYTAQDIVHELQDQTSHFPVLLEEVEKLFGKKLSTSQTATLLELYDHVGLPPEVLMMMIRWLFDKNLKKYGSARRLSMSLVKRTGYQWREHGYDTLEAADEYIRSCDLRESQVGSMLAACGIHGRPPQTTEGRFLSQWIDWGFPPESIALAADITMTKKGFFDWSYCNGVVRKWHEKNLHSPEEVRSEHHINPPAGQQNRQAPPPADSRENQAELRRLLRRLTDET